MFRNTDWTAFPNGPLLKFVTIFKFMKLNKQNQ